MSLTSEQMIALMQFADGELDGEENEKARAAVMASLETDADARAFLDEMERLSEAVCSADAHTLSQAANGGNLEIADAVMALVEEHEQKQAVTTRLDKSKKSPEQISQPVSSLEIAREKRRRLGVVVVTGLALAAGIALVMRSHPGEEMKSASLGKAPVPSAVATPVVPIPANSEAALAAASSSNVLGQEANAANVSGVEVNISDSPQTSVFYLPGSDGTSASAVVWIDESSGGK